jgi:hypothetical protein
MRKPPTIVVIVGLFLILLSLTSSPARADVVLDLTLDEMATMASLVVHGRVRSVDAAWDDSHQRIFTNVEIDVISYLGGSGPERVSVRQVGGRVGDTEIWVAGQPRFTVGEQIVAFLEPDGSDTPNRWVVLCMANGLFHVAHDELTGELVLERDLRGLTRTPGPGRMNLVRQHVARPLLLREISEAVARARRQGGPQ